MQVEQLKERLRDAEATTSAVFEAKLVDATAQIAKIAEENNELRSEVQSANLQLEQLKVEWRVSREQSDATIQELLQAKLHLVSELNNQQANSAGVTSQVQSMKLLIQK